MKGTGKIRKVNKYSLVQKHLIKKGKITSWEAIEKYRATRLSDIIWKLRNAGWDITSVWKTNKDGTRFTVYHWSGQK
tara:strand:- start:3044 stop:3274 length:231 start_codon:yes stop_codon:yes gene_type:complete